MELDKFCRPPKFRFHNTHECPLLTQFLPSRGIFLHELLAGWLPRLAPIHFVQILVGFLDNVGGAPIFHRDAESSRENLDG
jgi:hypothetical protein